ncbi:MAG: thioesterase family protein [Novosphingobium sp.]
MAKPDPALLDPTRYPFNCTIETRYRDLDSNLHINNGVFASLLEEGRVRFHRDSQFGGVSSDLTSMVVSAAIEYLGESHFPEPLDMFVGASRIGSTSYELCQLVMQGSDVIAFARVTLVCMKGGKPHAIPAEHRELAQPWLMAS